MKHNQASMKFRAGIAFAAVLLSVAAIQAATVEGFESVSLTQNGNAKGDASIQGVYFTINPTENAKQLLLTTIGANDVNNAGYQTQSATQAVPVSGVTGLAAFLGVSTAQINNGVGVNGTEGSAFKESFVLSAGQSLSFNYDFLTQEPSNGTSAKDFAFVTVLDSSNNLVRYNVISNYAAATASTTGAGNPFGNETHYQSFTISGLAAGTYTVGFGVVDTGNAASDSNPSGLLVDNISVAAVPEPSTLGLIVAGAAGFAAVRRRIRK